MRPFKAQIAAGLVAIATLTGGAHAAPFSGSVAMSGNAEMNARSLFAATDFSFSAIHLGTGQGSFIALGSSPRQTTLSGNHLNLRNIGAFVLSGPANGFGAFSASSWTAGGSSRDSVSYNVFGTYAETFSPDTLPRTSPNAEITFTFSYRGDGEDDCCELTEIGFMQVNALTLARGNALVPEPMSGAMLVVGLAGFAALRRRRAV